MKVARTLQSLARSSYVIGQGDSQRVLISPFQDREEWLMMHIPGAGSDRFAYRFPGLETESVSLQAQNGNWIWNSAGGARTLPFENNNDFKWRITFKLFKDKWVNGSVAFGSLDNNGETLLKCNKDNDVISVNRAHGSGKYSSWSIRKLGE